MVLDTVGEDDILIEIDDESDGKLTVDKNDDGDGPWLSLSVEGEIVIVEPGDARELGERLIEWARQHGA